MQEKSWKKRRGEKNFRNEIVWCYRGMPSIPTKFLNKHDTILYYTKSDNFTFNVQYGEATEGSKKTFENKKKLEHQILKFSTARNYNNCLLK